MVDTAEVVPRREAGFCASVVLAAISAILPFIPERWVGSVVVELTVLSAPILWVVAFRSATHFNRQRRWWLWFAAPFAMKSAFSD